MSAAPERTNLLGLPRAGLEAFVEQLGGKAFRARQLMAFRARQLMAWIYKRGAG